MDKNLFIFIFILGYFKQNHFLKNSWDCKSPPAVCRTGWDGIGMVIIGQRCSKSTWGANKDIFTNRLSIQTFLCEVDLQNDHDCTSSRMETVIHVCKGLSFRPCQEDRVLFVLRSILALCPVSLSGVGRHSLVRSLQLQFLCHMQQSTR